MKKMERVEKVDEDFADKLVAWSDIIRKTFKEGAIDDLISTRRLEHIVNAFAMFGSRMKAIEMCIARFDADTKTAFLFTRVGLAGCDMGACAILPRIVGQGRAADLLYTGRTMSADEGHAWGFWNALHAPEALEAEAWKLASRIAAGPTFAHGITKTQLNQEWNMGLEQAIEAEAQAQAICMQTRDFERAYHAFVAKEKPVFQGD